jgi:hypothetical protein
MELPTKNTAACNMMYDVTPFFAVDSMGFSWILLHSVITAEVTPQITAAQTAFFAFGTSRLASDLKSSRSLQISTDSDVI